MKEFFKKYKEAIVTVLKAFPIVIFLLGGFRYIVVMEENVKSHEERIDVLRNDIVRINDRLDAFSKQAIIMKNEIDDRVSVEYYRRNENIVKGDFRENDSLRSTRFKTLSQMIHDVTQNTYRNSGVISQLLGKKRACK